jgi:hypothetical protein
LFFYLTSELRTNMTERTYLSASLRSQIATANRAKRKGLTAAGSKKLRDAALAFKPWRFATGPTSPEGKARSAENGRCRQVSARSRRQLQADVADVYVFLAQMATAIKASQA